MTATATATAEFLAADRIAIDRKRQNEETTHTVFCYCCIHVLVCLTFEMLFHHKE